MSMLDRIMVALDGSPLAEQAVPFAAGVARAFDAEIILLRVVESGDGSAGRSLDSIDWRIGRAEAIDYLSTMKRRLKDQGIPVDIDVTSGRASDEILEMARVRNVDLVVLGSHGTGGLSQFQMASTAQKVVFGSDTSVLVVPAVENPGEGSAFTDVLVAVDGSPQSEWALSVAARLARSMQVALIVVHVVPLPTLLDPQGTARETELVHELVAMNRRAATRYLGRLKRHMEGPGLAIDVRVQVAADVAPALEQEAKSLERPLVVLSARCASRCEHGPFGGLVTVMLSGTEQPVLVLREPSAQERSPSRWRRERASESQRRATTPS
jgi:nucleotide-binding universal stress UspA family protein